MKKYLFTFVFVLFAYRAFSQQTKILFIGNSYTYVNDLPGTLYQLALSLGDSIIYDSNCPGGYTFNLHSTNITTLQKIALPGWNYVVLQAQSQEPSFSPAQVQAETYPYAARLDSLVHAANPCAYTMFYMTWGRKYGDASNCASYPPVCTFAGMGARLRESYLEMGSQNYSRVSPVGVAWKNAWQADSSINLWIGDNSHPSVAGTYLTACVFYASIFKQSPVGAAYTAGLTAPQAIFLQTIAQQTVLDSLDTWMLNQQPIHAGYSSLVSGPLVQFTSQSYNASSYQWNFGDGVGTSTLPNPSYTYSATGLYQVQLIVSNSCYTDTVTMPVNISTLGVNDVPGSAVFSIYPNPATEGIFIDGDNVLNQPYQLADISGHVIQSGRLTSNHLNVAHLSSGVYILQIASFSKRILIK